MFSMSRYLVLALLLVVPPLVATIISYIFYRRSRTALKRSAGGPSCEVAEKFSTLKGWVLLTTVFSILTLLSALLFLAEMMGLI